jgi:glycosyltransferase involved in cell wall biosynthesis
MITADCFVSVIAPLYNDARIVGDFVEEILIILRSHYDNYELVLINDGSDDDTSIKILALLDRYECIRVINLSRHFGREIAISSGLDAVIGDFIVVMMPACDPPQLIPSLIQECRSGKDISLGVRQYRRGEPLWLKIGATLFYWCCQKIFKILLPKNSTLFSILSRRVVNALTQVDDKYRYLRLLSFYVGYSSQTFVYEPIQRYKNSERRSLLTAMNLAWQIISINSVHPLRIASYLSLIASIFNLFYMVYIILIYLFKDKVAEGWITLSMQNAIMFFFISIILAILCEYIGNIFTKLRGWSAYYVASEQYSSTLISDCERRNVVDRSRNMKL